MKTLLFVSHTPSQNTENLAQSCLSEMQLYGAGLNIIHKASLDASAQDVLTCDALVIATTENIGYMAGLTKDFFDRGYNDWLYHTDGLPVAFYIRAGLDGTATASTLGRFAHGLRWHQIRPSLILKGDYRAEFEAQVAELGGAMAAGLDTGLF